MKRILIIQTAFIGDVILATSLVEQFALTFPETQIDFLLRKGNESLLFEHPHIRNVLIWDKRNHKVKGFLSILKTIRAERYDLVLNVHRFFSSGLFTVFSKATKTIGFNKNPLSFLFSKRVKHQFGSPGNPIHEVDRILQLSASIVPKPSARPRLYPPTFEQAIVDFDQPFITIAPASVWATKQWPAEKWINFINQIPSSLKICLMGGGGELDLCRYIQSKSNHKNIIVLAGRLSLLQSAALMRKARMNYVNDSAPLHLCSAVDAPVTAIFCSTVPQFGFTPLSKNSCVLETEESLACRPCGLHGKKACPLGHFKCAQIDVKRLLERLN